MNKLILLLAAIIFIPATGNPQSIGDSTVQSEFHDHGSHRKGHRHRKGFRLFHRHRSHGKHHGKRENRGHKHDHGSENAN